MSAKVYRRCWVYENAHGDVSVTCRPSVAKYWRRLFRERGEQVVVIEMRLTAVCRDGLKVVRAKLPKEGGYRG